jgi:hypothetical protein
MLTTYHLPNRAYSIQLHGMTESELIQTLGNVVFYCSLQILSLLLLVFILQQKLGLSPIHQLAFVLEKQAAGVQTRLIFWVFYNVQASLQHYGTVKLLRQIELCNNFSLNLKATITHSSFLG